MYRTSSILVVTSALQMRTQQPLVNNNNTLITRYPISVTLDLIKAMKTIPFEVSATLHITGYT
jgi:hypothetical protein